MATPYISSYNETIPFSDTCAQFALATTTALTYTVPGTFKNKYSVLMEYNCTSNVFVGHNVAATIPSAGTTSTTANIEYKPEQRYVIGGDVLSFITPDTSAWMGISLRAIPN